MVFKFKKAKINNYELELALFRNQWNSFLNLVPIEKF